MHALYPFTGQIVVNFTTTIWERACMLSTCELMLHDIGFCGRLDSIMNAIIL